MPAVYNKITYIFRNIENCNLELIFSFNLKKFFFVHHDNFYVKDESNSYTLGVCYEYITYPVEKVNMDIFYQLSKQFSRRQLLLRISLADVFFSFLFKFY